MNEYDERVYINEIAVQCEYAYMAVQAMNHALSPEGSNKEFFGAAHSFLQHLSIVSKLLWPSEKSSVSQARGKALRRRLQIQRGNCISDRRLRNHLEHYDERLDQWVQQSPHHAYIDHCIGPPSFVGGRSVDRKDIMRHFDPATNTFVFRGEVFDLQRMVDDLKKIDDNARERLTRRCS